MQPLQVSVETKRTLSSWKFFAVTAISGSRLPFAALFVLFALDPDLYLQRLSLFVLALLVLTDFIDGPLARHWGVTSMFGFVVDGVGDRALYLSSLLVMGERLNMPIILVYMIIIRDIILYAARSIQPSWVGLHGRTRWLAKAHAGALRGILALYFLPFYFRVFGVGIEMGIPNEILIGITVLYVALSYGALFSILRAYFMAHPSGDPTAASALEKLE